MSVTMTSRSPWIEHKPSGGIAAEFWDLPTDREFLQEFLAYVFSTYWDQLIYGPNIDGASYEMTCPCAPTLCAYSDGYLTIAFGAPHFHLCIDEMDVARTNPELRENLARRLPGKAYIFRRRDAKEAPISWGFSMENKAGEPMMSIYFANPFSVPGDKLLDKADYSRLAMWRDLSARYLGLDVDPLDETSEGYQNFAG